MVTEDFFFIEKSSCPMCLELITKQLTFVGGRYGVKLCKYKQDLHLEHQTISLRKGVAKEKKNRRTQGVAWVASFFRGWAGNGEAEGQRL